MQLTLMFCVPTSTDSMTEILQLTHRPVATLTSNSNTPDTLTSNSNTPDTLIYKYMKRYAVVWATATGSESTEPELLIHI